MPKASSAAQALRLTDIPNIGVSIAADLVGLGIRQPRDLVGLDPYDLYARINRETGKHHDPCLCDTFVAAVRFMEGGPPLPWWHYTGERKRRFAGTPATRDSA